MNAVLAKNVQAIPAPNSLSVSGPNLRSLDALRGLLACYVVLGHSRWLLWTGFAKWKSEPHSIWANSIAYASASLRYGHEAVMVFFVLSGFFIHLRSAQRLAEGKAAELKTTDYARRRVRRLLAPYVFALALTVLCDFIGREYFPELYRGATGDALLDSNFASKDFSLVALAPACAGLPGALGKDFGSNGPLWSLAYEVVYYALYPVWLYTRRRSPWLAYGLIPVGSICAGFVLPVPWIALVALHYPVWLAGAALAEWSAIRHRDGTATLIEIVGVAACLVISVFINQLLIGQIALATLLGVATVWLFAKFPATWASLKWHRICEAFGIRGYSIYICHFPMLVLLSAATIHLYGARPFSGWLAATGAAATLAVCCLAFEVCERRILAPRIRLETGNRDTVANESAIDRGFVHANNSRS